MSFQFRGRRATFILPTLLLIATIGCTAGDGDDDATSVAQTDTDPPTTSTTATDPSESSGTTPAESSTTDTPDESSEGETTDPGTTSADSSSDGGESSDSSGAAGLEIAGEWIDDFGGVHVVTDASWATTFAPDTFTYTITAYDNGERFVIAQDDGDDTWSKYEWTYVGDDLYYCQSTFGEASEDDAIASPDADPADPTTAGCGGFAWSLLTPQN